MKQSSELTSALNSLAEFPYLGNYLRLSMIEWDLLELKGDEHVLFIGSGPFPLTAICLNLISRAFAAGRGEEFRTLCESPTVVAENFCRQVSSIISLTSETANLLQLELLDKSARATDFASRMVSALGLARNLRAICGDGTNAQVSRECSLIYVASMVQPKEDVIKHMIEHSSRPLRFLIRGVEPGSLKELLYEPLSQESVANIQRDFPQFHEIKTYWPDNQSGVINSVHIFEHNPV